MLRNVVNNASSIRIFVFHYDRAMDGPHGLGSGSRIQMVIGAAVGRDSYWVEVLDRHGCVLD